MVNKDVYSCILQHLQRNPHRPLTNGFILSLLLIFGQMDYPFLMFISSFPPSNFTNLILINSHLLLPLLALWDNILIRRVDVIVASRNSRSLGVSQPRVLVGALPAGLHVACVGDVAHLVRQRALVGDVARFGCSGLNPLAVPGFNRRQLVQGLRFGDPGQGLSHGNEVNVGTNEEGTEKLPLITCPVGHYLQF